MFSHTSMSIFQYVPVVLKIKIVLDAGIDALKTIKRQNNSKVTAQRLPAHSCAVKIQPTE